MPSRPLVPPADPAERQALLTEARNAKMARSAHAYVRGSTTRFYEWLESLAPSSLPHGPPVWICGDCHLGNLGPVADGAGAVEILVRDFDQTVIGNPAHDLIRLGLSLSMAARGSDLPGVTTARMMEDLVIGYDSAFGPKPASSADRKPESVQAALRDAQRRSWRHLAEERVQGATLRLPVGRRFWPIAEAERTALLALFEAPAMRALAVRASHRRDDAKVEVVDAAYWVKGCSSLGRLRYAMLLDVGKGATRRRDLCLIDVKEAIKAAAPRDDAAVMPRDNAERVVEGARQMSPHLGDRMVAARLLDRAVFARELLPQDLKLEIDSVSTEQAIIAARYLGRVVGKAHARQMDAPTARAWRTELTRNRSKVLDAPSWLWSSVIDLVGSHERAYLDHCRRYALAAAA